jgi:hypothetical protein
MPTRTEITEILNREVNDANLRLREAHRAVDAIISETPGILPHPDGQYRIQNAIRHQASAREALQRAVNRNCDFTLNGIVPGDLEDTTKPL